MLAAVWRDLRSILAEAFRLDATSAILCTLFLVAAVPLISRSTGDARLLASFVNDEPPLTMALEAMTVRPFGNPANYFHNREPGRPAIPDHWGSKTYGGFFYYGGAYFLPAFVIFAPLKWLGLPTFPAAAIILRSISVLAGVLSLLALYNMARPRAGALGAAAAVVFLMLDGGFLYYALIIHPDTLQLLLGLIALAAAARHAVDGRIPSLVVLGILCGLIQGAKAGGAWTVPMGLLAMWWGIQSARERNELSGPVLRTAMRRTLVLGAAAAAAYVVSTPYAFLDRYYFRTLRQIYVTISATHPFEPATLLTWLRDLGSSLGPIYATIGSIALVWGLTQLRHARRDPLLGLAAVLALTQLLWYATQSKVWVILAYLLLALALTALLAVAFAARVLAWLPRRAIAGSFGIVLLAVAADRGYAAAHAVLHQHLRDCYTYIEINRWAAGSDLPRGGRIVHDDLAYFDPRLFPDVHMHGGILTWRALKILGPEYFVLSGSLYTAPHMRKLIETQNLSRDDPNEYSMRLYQDVLPASLPGPTAVPSIELIRIVRPSVEDPAAFCSAKSDHRQAAPAWQAPQWLKTWMPAKSAQLEDLVRLKREATGASNELFGTEMRVYRVAGLRPVAITDGALKGYDAQNVFEYRGRSWLSDKQGRAAEGSYIGADFGAASLPFARLTVRWIKPEATPRRVRLEYSSDGSSWALVYEAEVASHERTTFEIVRYGAQRYWRLVAAEVPEDGRFGVRELDFSH